MQTKLSDYNSASRLREIIRTIVIEVIDEIYPAPRFATVNAVNTGTRIATVEYPDDTTEFDLPYGGVVPFVGALVRVSGRRGARYVDDVLSDPP